MADWPVEIFAIPIEVDTQEGWRHFIAEQRLLESAGFVVTRG